MSEDDRLPQLSLPNRETLEYLDSIRPGFSRELLEIASERLRIRTREARAERFRVYCDALYPFFAVLAAVAFVFIGISNPAAAVACYAIAGALAAIPPSFKVIIEYSHRRENRELRR